MSAPSNWIPADKELPGNARCVLATDGEAHFVACWEGESGGDYWVDCSNFDEIDSVITHWMELPEVPE